MLQSSLFELIVENKMTKLIDSYNKMQAIAINLTNKLKTASFGEIFIILAAAEDIKLNDFRLNKFDSKTKAQITIVLLFKQIEHEFGKEVLALLDANPSQKIAIAPNVVFKIVNALEEDLIQNSTTQRSEQEVDFLKSCASFLSNLLSIDKSPNFFHLTEHSLEQVKIYQQILKKITKKFSGEVVCDRLLDEVSPL